MKLRLDWVAEVSPQTAKPRCDPVPIQCGCQALLKLSFIQKVSLSAGSLALCAFCAAAPSRRFLAATAWLRDSLPTLTPLRSGGGVWKSNPPFDPRRAESPALKAGKVTGPLSPPQLEYHHRFKLTGPDNLLPESPRSFIRALPWAPTREFNPHPMLLPRVGPLFSILSMHSLRTPAAQTRVYIPLSRAFK